MLNLFKFNSAFWYSFYVGLSIQPLRIRYASPVGGDGAITMSSEIQKNKIVSILSALFSPAQIFVFFLQMSFKKASFDFNVSINVAYFHEQSHKNFYPIFNLDFNSFLRYKEINLKVFLKNFNYLDSELCRERPLSFIQKLKFLLKELKESS